MNRLLGINDKLDYKNDLAYIKRESVRGIIIEDGKIYLSHARINDTYKIPGGGIDLGENLIDALIREVREEVGIDVDLSSIKEYGHYIEKWKSIKDGEDDKIWFNTSYYFICKRLGSVKDIKPTLSEINDLSESSLVSIDDAIKANLNIIKNNDPKYNFLIRENEILSLIKKELI